MTDTDSTWTEGKKPTGRSRSNAIIGRPGESGTPPKPQKETSGKEDGGKAKPVSPKQQAFMLLFLDGAKLEKEADTVRLKQSVSASIGLDIERQKAEIREGMTFTMEKQGNVVTTALRKAVGKNTMKSLDKKSDAMKEIDTFHDLKNLKALGGDDAVAAQKALEKVAAIADRMRSMKVTKDGEVVEDPNGTVEGEPLYKDDEIANEVWTPLVREGIIPENLVPDRYSNVKKTFDEASKLYDKRLIAYTEKMGDNAETMRMLGVAKDITKSMAQLGDEIVKAAGGPEVASTVIELMSIATEGSLSAAQAYLSSKDAGDLLQNIGNTAANMISAVSADLPPGVGDIVSLSITSAFGAGNVAAKVAQGKNKAALDTLADLIGSTLTGVAKAGGPEELSYVAIGVRRLLRGANRFGDVVTAVKDGGIGKAGPAISGFVDEMVGAIEDGAKAGLEANKDKLGDDTEKMAEGLVDSGGTMLTTLNDALLSGKPIDANKLSGAIVDFALTCCTDAIPPGHDDAVKAVTITLTGFKKSGGLVEAIVQKNPKKIGLSVVTMMAQAGAEAAVSFDAPEKLGDAIKKSVMGTLNTDAIAKALSLDDPDKVKDAIESLIKSAAKAITKKLQSVAGDDDEDDDDTAEDDEEATDAPEGGAGDGGEDDTDPLTILRNKMLDELKAKVPGLMKVLGDKSAKPEAKEKAKSELQKVLEQLALNGEVEEDADEFKTALVYGFTASEDDIDEQARQTEFDQNDIDRMIKKLVIQRKVFELVDRLSSMPISIAAKFFPPASAAEDFKKFSVETYKAIRCAQQLLQWMDNARDARKAVTVQVEAMLNRVGLSSRQQLEHSIQAALALISGIGSIIGTVGAHAAPAGIAVAAAAKAASGAMQVASKIYTEATMAQAWATYKKALKNPGDRKEARKALRRNPTLAKYAIAWGAYSENNPIAKEAVRKCGVNEKVLANPKTSVNKIVTYLEEVYSEDPVLLRAVAIPGKWYPGKVQLTLRSWMAFQAAAVEKVKLKEAPAGAINAAFTAVERTRFQHEKLPLEDKPKQAYVAALEDLKGKLEGYAPVDTSGKPHEDFATYLDTLTARIEITIRELGGGAKVLDDEDEMDEAA